MDRHKILYLWAVFTHTLLLFILLFLLSPDEEALGGRTQTMHRPLCTQVRRVERRLPEIPAPGIILHPGIPWSLKFYQFVYVCKSELAPRIPPDLTCLPLTRSPSPHLNGIIAYPPWLFWFWAFPEEASPHFFRPVLQCYVLLAPLTSLGWLRSFSSYAVYSHEWFTPCVPSPHALSSLRAETVP